MIRVARVWRAASVIIFLLSLLALVGCGGDSDGKQKVLKMGLIPADDAAEMVRNYQPVAAYLEKTLDMEVDIQVTADYTAAIEAMRNKGSPQPTPAVNAEVDPGDAVPGNQQPVRLSADPPPAASPRRESVSAATMEEAPLSGNEMSSDGFREDPGVHATS